MRDNELNSWLHTDILRQSSLCTGRFRPRKKPVDARARAWVCPRCQRVQFVTSFDLAYHRIGDTLTSDHLILAPDYLHDLSLFRSVLHRMSQMNQENGLLRYLLLRLGVSESELPLSHGAVQVIFQVELMGSSSAQMANKIHEAYRAMRAANWKDYHEREHYLLAKLDRIRTATGVPLFARLGPPQETYHEDDLPYALVYPSHRGYSFEQTAIIYRERDLLEWSTPLDVNLFGDTLKKEFRVVQGPQGFTDDRWRDYWSFYVQY
jgi:hypothetical protein